jgi:hypothetical protein
MFQVFFFLAPSTPQINKIAQKLNEKEKNFCGVKEWKNKT